MSLSDPHAHHRTYDGEPARLGALEAQVMDILWADGPITVRGIIDALPSTPAYTTISTVLANLRKKGIVCTGKDGHHTLYNACVSREEQAARIMEHALSESGDRAASIRHFLENMPEEDIQTLRTYLLDEAPSTGSEA